MSKNPKNNSVFSTLGASNHSEGERQKEDYYATDSRAIKHLIEKEPWLMNKDLKILEPCAGEGVLSDAWNRACGGTMDCYDIIGRREDVKVANYFETDFSNQYDAIITNPPYLKDSKAKPGLTSLIVKALKEVKDDGYVCLFLKTLHLESIGRYEKIYKDNPPTRVYVYAPRISCYRNNDTTLPQGAISYTWFVWHKKDGKFNGPTTIDWVSEL